MASRMSFDRSTPPPTPLGRFRYAADAARRICAERKLTKLTMFRARAPSRLSQQAGQAKVAKVASANARTRTRTRARRRMFANVRGDGGELRCLDGAGEESAGPRLAAVRNRSAHASTRI